MQGRGAHPDRQQLLRQPVRRVLGVQEHDHASVAGGDLRRRGVLVLVLHVQHVVLHRGDGAGRGVDRVDDGVVQVVPDQPVDVAVQGGGEQHPLAVGKHLIEQLRHLRHEAHVGHLVGLVEDGDGDPVQPAVAPVDEVLEAAGRGHDDLGAAAQGARLPADRQTADHRGEPQPQRAGVGGEGVGDLLGQFPGGDEDQGQRLPGLGPLSGRTGQQREPEGEGLAGTRAATAQDVPAGQRVRQRRGLDRERGGHTLGAEGGQQPLGHVEVGERLDGRQSRGEGHGQREFTAGRGGTTPASTPPGLGRTGRGTLAPVRTGADGAVAVHPIPSSKGQNAMGRGPHSGVRAPTT